MRVRRSSVSRPARSTEAGAVLLLVMLVVSILFVTVGQLSYSVALDHALAQNHLADTRIRCDLRSAAEIFRAAVSQNPQTASHTVALGSGTAAFRWTNETGKFNLNVLRAEDSRVAMQQFERLFELLEEEGSVAELGLAGKITDLVLASDRPLVSIRELLLVEGITEELLEGETGLVRYLTVYSDGRINIAEAPVPVLACLDESLNNDETIELLKQAFKDGEARVPDYVRNLARRLRRSVTTEAAAYRALITLTGQTAARTLEVAVKKGEDVYVFVLYNELDQNHEQFDE